MEFEFSCSWLESKNDFSSECPSILNGDSATDGEVSALSLSYSKLASFEYDKDKADTSPSVAESPLRIEGHSELKSFFDSNQEHENSNSTVEEGLSESKFDHVENDKLKPLNPNSKPVQIHSPEDNQGNKDDVGISNRLPLEFDHLKSVPLGNSDLPTVNQALNEASFNA